MRWLAAGGQVDGDQGHEDGQGFGKVLEAF